MLTPVEAQKWREYHRHFITVLDNKLDQLLQRKTQQNATVYQNLYYSLF